MDKKQLKALPKPVRKRIKELAKAAGFTPEQVFAIQDSVGEDHGDHLLHVGAVVMLAKLGGKVTVTREQYEVVARDGAAFVGIHRHGDEITFELSTMPEVALPGETVH